MGSTRQDLDDLPASPQRAFKDKISFLTEGLPLSGLKPYKGIGGGKEALSTGFRMIMCFEFDGVIGVLHVFKKDASKKGRRNRTRHSDTIDARYKAFCTRMRERQPRTQ